MESIVANQAPAGITDLPDRELLRRYLAGQDRSALEALVRRHGGMVLGVCRRMLGDRHEAEDAFQATFLVFVRKAGTIRSDGLVGPWLYGVATRTALKARALAARRRAREKQVSALPNVPGPAGPAAADWLPLLDREVAGLPAKYRLPVLLCDLHGLSRGDASRQLAIPEGTLSSRLARARELLRRRLSKRGVGATVLLAAVVFPSAAPAALVETTVRAATAFAAGAPLATPPAVLATAVLAGFRRAGLALAAAVLASLALIGGGAFLLLRGGGPATMITAQAELQILEGDWTVTAITMDGAAGIPPGAVSVQSMSFRGNHVNWPFESDFTIDPTAHPKQITMTCPKVPPPNNLMLGIYQINGDEMKFCISAPGNDRPAEFATAPGSMRFLVTLKRRRAEQ
ncbi:MAG TPA: sigma-70 family RNA polymerase sigma factor [Gemmataceae bacterium]|jgi:RNA polymerase sigma factor (sigma-70 family)|nr:sigma-70 family RNA polymerase sigma factor [Gemmataceae bacterium]